MVPASFGCGAVVFAAMAILAPSRAARSAIASPMPRDAPVMNSVFPLSDMRPLFLAREKCGESAAGFLGGQTILELCHLGVDLLFNGFGMAAHQTPRYGDGAGGEGGNFLCGFECSGFDFRGIDDFVDEAGLLCPFGRKRPAHHKHRESARIAHA